MARIPAVSDGARLTQDITFSDNSGVAFGKADDITVRWDGTDLDVLPAATSAGMPVQTSCGLSDLSRSRASTPFLIATN